jgi:hypothetical protein
MADLNIVNVSDIKGRVFGANVTSSLANTIVNTFGQSKVFKVNNILLSNRTPANTIAATVNFVDYGSGNSFPIVQSIDIPAKSSIEVLSKSIYLEEGDRIMASCTETGNAVIIISYEELS